MLEGLIGDGHGTALVLSEEFDAPGAQLFDHACKLGLEGIVSKRRDGPYRSGKKHDEWVKTKCVQSDEFLIIGYQPSKATRGALGRSMWRLCLPIVCIMPAVSAPAFRNAWRAIFLEMVCIAGDAAYLLAARARKNAHADAETAVAKN